MTDPTAATVAGTPTARAPRWEPGAALGRYRMIALLGTGGMGQVWEAEDPELDRRVAVKLLHRGLSAARERLQREARAMARLAHPNVITVHDVGDDDGQLFVAMELIDGGSLRAWLKSRPPWRAVVAAFVAAGRGLVAAHRAGLVHRDFKPDNVLRRSDGRIVVSDFGLARLDPTAEPDAVDVPREPLATITMAGGVLGTPAYMAPEQHVGRPATAASDQFAFCVTLWEALYGERPFAAADAEAMALAIVDGRLRTPPRDAGVPGWLRAIVTRGLAVEADHRYPSMEALVLALERGLSRRRRLAIGAGAVAVAGLIGTLALWPHPAAGPRCDDGSKQLAGSWDAAASARVRQALLATGRPFAADTAGRVIALLDRYGHDWAAMRDETCRATHREGRQSAELLDLRNACLDGRRTDLASLAAALSDAPDAATVRLAIDAARGLEPLDACADADRLRSDAPPPTDPARAAHLDAANQTLARAKAQKALGHYREALEIVGTAGADAAASEYAPVQAEVLFLRGNLEDTTGDPAAARATLEQAARFAADGHVDVGAARIAVELLDVIGVGLDRPDEARGLRPWIDALIRRAGDPPSERILFLEHGAGLLIEGGQLDEARSEVEEALRRADRELEPDDGSIPSILENLAGVALAQGRWADAAALHERERALVEQIFGPDHPQTATLLDRTALGLLRVGRYDEAAPLAQRALEIRTRALGADDPEVDESLQTLANIASGQGDREGARGRYRELVERTQARQDPLAQIDALEGLGVVENDLGDAAAAEEHLGAALALRASRSDVDSLAYAFTEYNVANAQATRGACDLARPHLDHVVSVMTKAGVADSMLAYPLQARADCEVHAGDAAAARADAERAVTGCGDDGCPPLLRWVAEATLGEARWIAGDRAAGAAALTRARKELAAIPDAKPALAQLDAWMKQHGVR